MTNDTPESKARKRKVILGRCSIPGCLTKVARKPNGKLNKRCQKHQDYFRNYYQRYQQSKGDESLRAQLAAAEEKVRAYDTLMSGTKLFLTFWGQISLRDDGWAIYNCPERYKTALDAFAALRGE